jgi:hypothetical protein
MGIQQLSSTTVDVSLSSFLGWAGSNFPYNSNSADITISGATTWNDACGYRKVGKLTINAGQTLTITKSPFYIFADEINFGDTSSCIDASGLSGSATPTTFPTTQANGGTAQSGSALAQGGCGGGMLFILCNRITGANGVIKANGGNGYKNVTNADSSTYGGGQGALSSAINYSGSITEKFYYLLGELGPVPEGDTSAGTLAYSLDKLLGAGGGAIYGGVGGGSGSVQVASPTSNVCGSSGIGGGGSGTESGCLPTITPLPTELLMLANLRCLGGGGGPARVHTNGFYNCTGGGGGGSIVVWTHTATATPTLQANGGIGTSTSNSDGAAGVTYLITL